MSYAQRMLQTNPSETAVDAGVLVECIEAYFDCAQACAACADACLGEEDLEQMVRCIRLCLDCTDACETTGRILSRQTMFQPDLTRGVVEACAQACRICAEECEKHARDMNMEHCRVCAEACRRCEEVCNNLLSQLPSTSG